MMAALIRLAIALASIPLNGLALSVLWGWFICPLGVPRLGIAQALGVSTLISLFMRGKADEDDDKKSPALKVAVAVLLPLFALAIGWAEHWFMVR